MKQSVYKKVDNKAVTTLNIGSTYFTCSHGFWKAAGSHLDHLDPVCGNHTET